MFHARRFALTAVTALLPIGASAGLVTTSVSGNLIVEALSGSGGDSFQEFGIGTSLLDAVPIFTIQLVGGAIGSVSPSPVIDAGYFAGGTSLDFYNISSWKGPQYAFSANLSGAATPSDRVVFLDTDNSLGYGGSVVEVVGPNEWILHLDDAASWQYDDDDNEMVIRLRVAPSAAIPEPSTLGMLLLALPLLGSCRRRVISARRAC